MDSHSFSRDLVIFFFTMKYRFSHYIDAGGSGFGGSNGNIGSSGSSGFIGSNGSNGSSGISGSSGSGNDDETRQIFLGKSSVHIQVQLYYGPVLLWPSCIGDEGSN